MLSLFLFQPPPPPRPNGHAKPSPTQLKATGARLAIRPQATVNGTHLSVGGTNAPSQIPGSNSVSTHTTHSSQGLGVTNGGCRPNGNNNNIAGRISTEQTTRSTQSLTSSGQQARPTLQGGVSNGTGGSHQVRGQTHAISTQSLHPRSRSVPKSNQPQGSVKPNPRSHSPPSQLRLSNTNTPARGNQSLSTRPSLGSSAPSLVTVSGVRSQTRASQARVAQRTSLSTSQDSRDKTGDSHSKQGAPITHSKAPGGLNDLNAPPM